MEDSKFLRMAIEKTFVSAGYSVLTASDGAAGLQAVRDKHPDLVLLDMMLPKLSGIDVLRLLKQDSATKDIPVLVLTGLSEKNKERLFQEGAAGYVEKSDALLSNSPALVETVATVLQGAQLLQ